MHTNYFRKENAKSTASHISEKRNKWIPEFSIRYNRENIELPEAACRSKTLVWNKEFVVTTTKSVYCVQNKIHI